MNVTISRLIVAIFLMSSSLLAGCAATQSIVPVNMSEQQKNNAWTAILRQCAADGYRVVEQNKESDSIMCEREVSTNKYYVQVLFAPGNQGYAVRAWSKDGLVDPFISGHREKFEKAIKNSLASTATERSEVAKDKVMSPSAITPPSGLMYVTNKYGADSVTSKKSDTATTHNAASNIDGAKSIANTGDTFSEKPPSQEQLTEMVKTVLQNNIDRFCFSGNRSADITQDARGMYLSFGKSAETNISSLEIKQVGKYKGYWPIEVHVTGNCTLQYRDDFAQNSPAFSHWRGRTLTTAIDTVLGVDVRENDFGKPQVRLRE